MRERLRIKLSILNRLKLYRQSLELRLLPQVVNFQIRDWYGRLGNNVQQILIAVMHAESYGGIVEITEQQLATQGLNEFFTPLLYDFSNGKPITKIYRSNFFFFDGFAFSLGQHLRLHCVEGFLRRDSLLSAAYVHSHLHRVCEQYLRSHLRSAPSYTLNVSESVLVLHLRSGDVANLQSALYATNPLCYYQFLSSMHREVALVAEPGPVHPLLNRIRGLFSDCKVVSGSTLADFELLRSARFLASSGVGTFSVAAALLSEKLQRFYCSSAYLNEHLNPAMLDPKRVDVVEYKMKGYLDLWHQSSNRLDWLIHDHH